MNMLAKYQIALFMALSAAFTLFGYEFIRSSSTVLFKTAYGADNLPLVMAANVVVVFLGVALYGRILTRFGPRRTLALTSLTSALIIAACYLALLAGSKMITPVLYLVKELYIVLLIEQYWSYINSSLSREDGKKLNGPITGIAGMGAAVGGFLLARLAQPLGTESMVLIGALSLIPAAAMADFTYRLHGEPEEPSTPPASHMGLDLFSKSSLLRCLLAIVLSAQVIAAVLDLKFQSLLSEEFQGRIDEETAFQGLFFGWLSTLALVLQFVVAPLLLSLVSLRLVHIIMPLIHLVAIGWAIIEPSILSVGLAFFLFKAFDYSVFRAGKEVLYIPLSFDSRYRAKEVIDVFAYRSGKSVTAVGVAVLQRLGVVMTNYYTLIALVAAGLWLILVFPLTRDDAERRQVAKRPDEM